ncbi:MAG: HIT family protein [Firmicutes bacterium]|nr:HIT family protein [Bacillota bacterium]
MTAAPKKQACPFCRIAAGEEPAYVVYEDETLLAFLDRRPLFPGHSLLIPKEHYQTLTDLPEEAVGPLFRFAKLLARAVEEAMAAEGTFVAINTRVSQSVPHLHVHIVPRRRGDGLRGFFWPRQGYRDEAHALAVKEAIKAAVARHLREDRHPS